MSRAKEIQEKLNLQAKLQTSFDTSASKVLDWLKTDNEKDSAADGLNNSKTVFFELPVMQTGSGLDLTSNTNSADQQDDIRTVGEFITSDKKVNSLSKKKQRAQLNTQTNNIYKISKDDTKAMVALKRRVRKTQRGGTKVGSPSSTQDIPGGSRAPAPRDDQDESDDEPKIEKTSKKQFGLLFDKSKKRRK